MVGEGIGDRLRKVRKAMKLSQTEFGEIGGVGKRAQIYFEQGENEPGASYWQQLHAQGVDSAYILTGAPGARDVVESELLSRFRDASPDVQKAVLRALNIPATTQKAASVAITGGEQGQVVAGNVKQRDVTFNVGGKKGGARK